MKKEIVNWKNLSLSNRRGRSFVTFFFFIENPIYTGAVFVTRENEIPRYQLITGRNWKKAYATDVSVLDRKEGNISPTMVQKWQEGVKLSTRKLMVVRTSYSGMRESVHNKTGGSGNEFFLPLSVVTFVLVSYIYRTPRITSAFPPPPPPYLTISRTIEKLKSFSLLFLSALY